MSDISNVTVILPSLNPDEKLLNTVKGLIEVGFKDIVIINDGSEDENTEYFPNTDEYPQCTVINHWINRGKGAGLKTAFAYIKKARPNCVGVVTADGDGQHSPKDIFACTERMLNENKVILGARNFDLPNIPSRSVFGNKATSCVFRFLCGMKITDTQTGLRAFPIEHLDFLMGIKGERFEYETNMLLEFKEWDIEYAEQPIETVYIEENKTSHFNPLKDSFSIYAQILKYAFSSLSATAIDLGLFALFFALLFPTVIGTVGTATAVSTIIARVLSSIYNYVINYRFVFSKRKNADNTLIKYCILSGAVMAVSALGTALIAKLLPSDTNAGTLTVIKAVVDTLLFFVTFTVQREWVFGGKKKK